VPLAREKWTEIVSPFAQEKVTSRSAGAGGAELQAQTNEEMSSAEESVFMAVYRWWLESGPDAIACARACSGVT
jgi:hypothetical protein